MTRWVWLAVGLLAAFGIGACGGDDDSNEPGDGAQMVIGSSEEPTDLNPLFILPHHFPVHAPYTLIFDSLIQIAPDGSFQPRLAEEWTIAEDNLTVTFTLDQDAKFHNGDPVTAADVVFTFELMMDDELTTTKDGTANVEAVTALDEHTVEVRLSTVDPKFMATAGSRLIVPRALLEGEALETASFNRDPVGSGPFKFASWSSGAEIVMEANPDYHLGAPYIERLIFKIVPDQNALVAQLRTGELDYGLIDPKDYTVVKEFSGLEIVEAPSPRFYSLGLSFALPIFQDLAVREALMYATPGEDLVNTVLEGHGTIVRSNSTPASWAYNEDVEQREYDLDEARRVLDEAGWKEGGDGIRSKDGIKLEFETSYIASEAQSEQALVILQESFRQVGIAMALKGMEAGDLLGRAWPQGDFEATFQLWNPVYDPDQSSTFMTGGGYNGMGYSNTEVDSLFKEALSTLDQGERTAAYARIQQILADDLPMIWMYSNNEINVLDEGLDGFEAHPINNFWNAHTWEMR